MSKNPFANLAKPSFDDVSELYPIFKEHLAYLQKFRVAGLEAIGAGLFFSLGCFLGFLMSAPDTPFYESSFSDALLYFIPTLTGLGIAFIGGLIFSFGEINIKIANRSYDRVMKPLLDEARLVERAR